ILTYPEKGRPMHLAGAEYRESFAPVWCVFGESFWRGTSRTLAAERYSTPGLSPAQGAALGGGQSRSRIPVGSDRHPRSKQGPEKTLSAEPPQKPSCSTPAAPWPPA